MECEEDLIFPYLAKKGYGSLCRVAEREHRHLRETIDNLMALVLSFHGITFGEFQIRLTAIAQQLVPALREHLTFEDSLLYPMALVVIDDNRTWHVVKALYDQMGYGDHVNG
jgi:hemerythrin-like domain-containing protein